ncbi:MAG TPA: sulfatase-like hydrolase/transferase, partial [Pirellulales bacterium]
TLPRRLQVAGYRTIHCGKGHFGPFGSPGEDPRSIGFDVNIAGAALGQPGSYFGAENFAPPNGKNPQRGVPGLEKYHGRPIFLTEALTLELNAAIGAAVEERKPFFAYMAHYAVHAPFNADPRFVGRYSDQKPNVAAFAALIEGMDKSLGDVLDHLETLGVAENTLVLFVGDNGSDAPHGPEHAIACAAPLRGKKGTHYEGGMRVPFIAAWAKPSEGNSLQQKTPIEAGATRSEMGAIYDLNPTVLAAAGEAPSGTLDGVDLRPLFAPDHKTPSEERAFVMHFPHEHRSSYFTVYRRGDWKLIYHHRKPAGQRCELFNLSIDRDESHNLAATEPQRLAEMFAGMTNALAETDAQMPLGDDHATPLAPTLDGAK